YLRMPTSISAINRPMRRKRPSTKGSARGKKCRSEGRIVVSFGRTAREHGGNKRHLHEASGCAGHMPCPAVEVDVHERTGGPPAALSLCKAYATITEGRYSQGGQARRRHAAPGTWRSRGPGSALGSPPAART